MEISLQRQAIGELHARSSRLTCARRKSSNSSRSSTANVLQRRESRGWYSCRAVPCCSERSARLEICRPSIISGTGPSGSQRSSLREMIAWRVAWGQGAV